VRGVLKEVISKDKEIKLYEEMNKYK
jgi:hypothetical protein